MIWENSFPVDNRDNLAESQSFTCLINLIVHACVMSSYDIFVNSDCKNHFFFYKFGAPRKCHMTIIFIKKNLRFFLVIFITSLIWGFGLWPIIFDDIDISAL